MSDSTRSEGLLPLTVAVNRPQPDVCVLQVTGELDIATAPLLAGHLREQAGTAEVLVLDLSGVTLLAASGVALIVNAHRDGGVPGRLHLLGVTDNRPVARVLALTGVLDLLEVHDTLAELLTALHRR